MPEAFDRLGIEPFAVISIRTPSTRRGEPHRCDQFDVSISLVANANTFVIPSVHAIASDDFSPAEQVHAIIGRDILDRCVFEYFGPHKQFRLCF